MGGSHRETGMILLMDDYGSGSRLLHGSLKTIGAECTAVVTGADGFLPDDVHSVYDMILGYDDPDRRPSSHAMSFGMIKVPDYWEISCENNVGRITEYDRERARIYYAEPKRRRLVRLVEWKDARGVVRLSEHYNKYGVIYAKTVYNEKGQKVNISYFNTEGKECIHENYVTGDIILTVNNVDTIYRDKVRFIADVLRMKGYAANDIYFNSLSYSFFVSLILKRTDPHDVLFWQEGQREDIPDYMQRIFNGECPNISSIVVQKEDAYREFERLGATGYMKKMGFIYPFERENTAGRDILICTNSDNILHFDELVTDLREMRFHVAALTEMSDKLIGMSDHPNVTLYPAVRHRKLEELFDKCDIYLDINKYDEIEDAVYRAFLRDQLILAFRGTVHRREFVPDEHVFDDDDHLRLAQKIRTVAGRPEEMRNGLGLQKKWALSENAEDFASFVRNL